MNRTFERWTGHPREEIVGRRLADLLTTGGRIYHETHYAPLLAMQGEVREIALELRCRDGSALPVLVNSVRVGDEVRTALFGAAGRREYERELLSARRRAERLQEHTALLARTSRALEESTAVAERAQRLADLLAGGPASAAIVKLWGSSAPVAASGADADDPRLQEAADAALRTAGARLGDGAAAEAADGTSAPYAAVPLLAGSRVVGALAVARTGFVDGIPKSDLPLLEGIADQAALALENARLFEHERRVARTLQRSMLPDDLPEDPRCVIGTHYAPGAEGMQVGGDWHDAFMLGPDRIGLVVGDVVGHGLQAAATMGQLRHTVRGLAAAQLGPARVLERLDSVAEQGVNVFGATIVYAEVDLSTGAVTFACAGHPPPVLAAPGAPPAALWDGRSAPLGAYIAPFSRVEASARLVPGARLVLYTDGLVERRDRPLDGGIAALTDALRQDHGVSLADLGRALSRRLGADHGHDDVCVLVLGYGPPATATPPPAAPRASARR